MRLDTDEKRKASPLARSIPWPVWDKVFHCELDLDEEALLTNGLSEFAPNYCSTMDQDSQIRFCHAYLYLMSSEEDTSLVIKQATELGLSRDALERAATGCGRIDVLRELRTTFDETLLLAALGVGEKKSVEYLENMLPVSDVQNFYTKHTISILEWAPLTSLGIFTKKVSQDLLKETLEDTGFYCYRTAIEQGDLKRMIYFEKMALSISPETLQNMLYSGYMIAAMTSFDAFKHIESKAKTLAPQVLHHLQKEKTVFAYLKAAHGGQLDVMKHLEGLSGDEGKRLIDQSSLIEAIRIACVSGNLEVMKHIRQYARRWYPPSIDNELLEQKSPNILVEVDDRNEPYYLYRIAAEKGHLEIMTFLERWAGPSRLRAMVEANRFDVLHTARQQFGNEEDYGVLDHMEELVNNWTPRLHYLDPSKHAQALNEEASLYVVKIGVDEHGMARYQVKAVPNLEEVVRCPYTGAKQFWPIYGDVGQTFLSFGLRRIKLFDSDGYLNQEAFLTEEDLGFSINLDSPAEFPTKPTRTTTEDEPRYFDAIELDHLAIDDGTVFYLVEAGPSRYSIKAISCELAKVSKCPYTGVRTFWPIEGHARALLLEEGMKEHSVFFQSNGELSNTPISKDEVLKYLKYDVGTAPMSFDLANSREIQEELGLEAARQMQEEIDAERAVDGHEEDQEVELVEEDPIGYEYLSSIQLLEKIRAQAMGEQDPITLEYCTANLNHYMESMALLAQLFGTAEGGEDFELKDELILVHQAVTSPEMMALKTDLSELGPEAVSRINAVVSQIPLLERKNILQNERVIEEISIVMSIERTHDFRESMRSMLALRGEEPDPGPRI